MSAPYVTADSNHISFQLFARFSEPDFLALHLCDITHLSSEHPGLLFSLPVPVGVRLP